MKEIKKELLFCFFLRKERTCLKILPATLWWQEKKLF